MKGSPKSPWGKLHQADDGSVIEWHPLIDHCADVATVCERLLADDVLRRRLARLGGLDLDGVAVARLCVLAALHDAGKANHGFQRKSDPDARDTEGHVGSLFQAMFSDEPGLARAVRDALRVDLVMAWRAEHLLYAALAHHGRPISEPEARKPSRPALWKRVGDHDPIACIADIAERALRWFPEALLQHGSFPDDEPAFSHAFAGLVTWADWLASDSTLFPFSEEDDGERIGRARQRAIHALQATGIDCSQARVALADGFRFQQVFPNCEPRRAQQAVLGLPTQAGGGLVILEAETGSGKTEAALAHFFALFGRGEVDGLYFALPTRTAATQMHERVQAAIGRVFPEATPPVILAVPGYLKAGDEAGTQRAPALARFQSLWPDEVADRLRWRAWAAERSKRYLAGAVSVGTIDQVLMSALAAKHAHLRATALLRQLLVVDEVHASDAYMNGLLEEVLCRHLRAGGHALLMSATLGGATRERLASGRRRPPALSECLAVPYPALTTCAAEARTALSVRGVPVDDTGATGKRVAVELVSVALDHAAMASRAADAARAGARVIVMRNKVADAVKTQIALESALGDSELLFRCAGRPAPHHSRFTREDRAALDREIQAVFGKERSGPGRVVVATQTIQQSLDLDADLLLTDICPMDVLLQRIGRLHRHVQPPDRPRTPGFEAPRVIVLLPERDLGEYIGPKGTARGPIGLGAVYTDLRIIEATRLQLVENPVLHIPAMNRALVERTTHPEALREVAARRGGSWVQHEQVCDGTGMARTGAARLATFQWDEPYGEKGFPPHIEATASTRLGANDRLAVFAEPLVTPFGNSSRELAIPSWLARGAAEDVVPDVLRKDVSAGSVCFRFGDAELVYDRLGLRRAGDEAKVSEEDAGHG
jgi:CRISPR-associated endonuclease/helicase Cas3